MEKVFNFVFRPFQTYFSTFYKDINHSKTPQLEIYMMIFFGRGRHPRHSHGCKGGTPEQALSAPGGQTLSETVSPQPHQRPEPLCGAADADFDEPKG